MPDDDFDQTNDDDQNPDPAHRASVERRLREKAERELAAKDSELADLQRKLAFTEAGLPDTPQLMFFKNNYAGDATPEAIRQAAIANGFLQAPNQPTPEERATLANMGDTAAGAEPSITPESDAAKDAELHELFRTSNRSDPMFSQKVEAIVAKYGGDTTLGAR